MSDTQLNMDDWANDTINAQNASTSNQDNHSGVFYVVDGSSYIYRAFYAIRHLSNSKGMPTNAIYGFTQMIKRLIEEENPDYIAVTFDAFEADEHTFRKELYADYKANRSAMPDELKVQIPYFRQVIEALNIPIMVQPGVEADDLIATATHHARRKGLDVCIISADKDLMQLLDPHITMYDTMRGKVFKEADVEERFGVPPKSVKYVLALSGDSSDNIPGVPGIGEKTGGKLIQEFGDLENLLANIDAVSGKKRRENLTEFADQARLSLELVTLRHDCPIDFDLEHLRLTSPHFSRVQKLFHELEFQTLLRDIEQWMKKRGWNHGLNDDDSIDDSASIQSHEKSYRGVFTMQDFEEVLKECTHAERFAFDLETTSLNPFEAEIVGIALAWQKDEAVYIPVGHNYDGVPGQLDRDVVLKKLKPLLESDKKQKICQNYKYELLVLNQHGIDFKGLAYDTMLMSYLLNPERNSHGMDALALEVLGHQTIKYGDVAGTGKQQVTFDKVSIDKAIDYAAEDADITLALCESFIPELEQSGLKSLHDELEVPLARVLAKMESTGIGVDCEMLARLSEEFEQQLNELQNQINELAGGEVNPNSPVQLREVLFERLGLPIKKRTKTGPSTDQSVLEQLAELHELPQLILDYRSFSKLKGTYVDALPALIQSETGRIHTDFNQAVAATGRLSSSNPNLQNIPIRTAKGREIRRAFAPEPGWKLMAVDYSQIELRLMAQMSKDPVLLKAYQENLDIHSLTASQVCDVALEDVTSEQRRVGKTINFGVMYGMGSRRLARDLKISTQEAKKYIDTYFERYHVVAEFFDQLVSDAHTKGYTETLFGRRRLLPGLKEKGGQLAFAERAAINTPIQGTAADIIKYAMIVIQNEIDCHDLPIRMLLQVHDELVFEVREDYVEKARIMICEKMEGVVQYDIPLKVDVGIGDNWLDAK